ncbi:MAG: spondin domain-containing protein [Bacteroides sp.]|nr:spondin domain-containing protein [Bacteroides sp.]
MFATMYGASKDWFFAPENPGINLYNDDGTPITGDVSSQIRLWDNGTKDNMTGTAESANIMEVEGVDASTLMSLKLEYVASSSEFTLTIMNTSGSTANETPFSPGVWAASNVFGGKLLNEMPFYKKEEMSNAEITAIAQSGDNTLLSAKISDNTGIITGISPAIVVVYTGDVNPIYEAGKKDAGIGLTNLAQMGDASMLKTSLEKMSNVKKVYIAGSAPVAPGEKVEVQFDATENDHIAYATMFGYSNDWFYANDAMIPASFKGDVTEKTTLYDDGTAVSQYPGAGNAQGLFTGKPEKEDKNIMKIDNMFPVPTINMVLKVIIK